jgi:hypothetical protein
MRARCSVPKKIPASSNAQRAGAPDPGELGKKLNQSFAVSCVKITNGQIEPADRAELAKRVRAELERVKQGRPRIYAIDDRCLDGTEEGEFILEDVQRVEKSKGTQTSRELAKVIEDNINKSRAAHARSGRSKTVRERTIVQGIDEETKGWDRKHPWKKAGEIDGAINARLEEARLKTISVSALYQRLLKIV